MSTISLVLKLVATSFFAIAAALSHRKLRREEVLFFQRRDILRRIPFFPNVGTLPFSQPPKILILGFRGHGKSSFINTACRVLSGEDGPLMLRTDTAPLGTGPWTTPVTRSDRIVKVLMRCSWGEEEEYEEEDDEAVVVEMVDTPGFSPMLIGNNLKEEVEKTLLRSSTMGTTDCVVVVVRCPGVDVEKRMGVLKMIGDLTTVVRDHGLNMVVVLTDKNAMNKEIYVEELRKEAIVMSRTDCVYVIDNYTSETNRSFSTANNFDTHFNVLAIIRQCMEYSVIHRNNQNNHKEIH